MAEQNLGAAMNGQGGSTKSPSNSRLTKALNQLTQQAEANSAKVTQVEKFVVSSAENLGSNFLASVAEGFYGPDRMKVGPLDIRAGAGLLISFVGVKQSLDGVASASHYLNVGGGILASFAASAGRNTGAALKNRAQNTITVKPESVTTNPTMQGVVYFPPQTNGLLPAPGAEGTRQVLPDLNNLPVMMSPATGDDYPSPSRDRRRDRRGDRRHDRRNRFQNVPRANAEE